MRAADLVRSVRERQGLSQRALARRAGTTQAWISAIERGAAQPTEAMLRRLLAVMGDELVLESRPLTSDAEHDPIAFSENQARTAGERLEEGLRWMRTLA